MNTIQTDKGILGCYASGSGALSYNYGRRLTATDRTGSVGDIVSIGSPKTVEEIPAELVPKDWVLAIHNGSVIAMAKVFRTGPDQLQHDNQEFRYTVVADYGDWKRYHFEFCAGCDQWLPLLNANSIAVLRFFLENELFAAQTLAAYLDYAI